MLFDEVGSVRNCPFIAKTGHQVSQSTTKVHILYLLLNNSEVSPHSVWIRIRRYWECGSGSRSMELETDLSLHKNLVLKPS